MKDERGTDSKAKENELQQRDQSYKKLILIKNYLKLGTYIKKLNATDYITPSYKFFILLHLMSTRKSNCCNVSRISTILAIIFFSSPIFHYFFTFPNPVKQNYSFINDFLQLPKLFSPLFLVFLQLATPINIQILPYPSSSSSTATSSSMKLTWNNLLKKSICPESTLQRPENLPQCLAQRRN